MPRELPNKLYDVGMIHRSWQQHAKTVLQKNGFRSSGPRSAVVDAFAENPCLLTAQEVVGLLKENGAPGSAASVYRALETLHALGLLRRFDAASGLARYEVAHPTGEHHHHLIDAETGSVTAFEDEKLEHIIAAIGERLGVELTGHEVVLYGKQKDP